MECCYPIQSSWQNTNRFPYKLFFLRQTNTKLDKHEVCGAYVAVFVYNLGKSVRSELQRGFFPSLDQNLTV